MLRSVGGWIPFSIRLIRVKCWPVVAASAWPVSPAVLRIWRSRRPSSLRAWVAGLRGTVLTKWYGHMPDAFECLLASTCGLRFVGDLECGVGAIPGIVQEHDQVAVEDVEVPAARQRCCGELGTRYVANVLASFGEQSSEAEHPLLVLAQRFGHYADAAASAACRAVPSEHLQPPSQPAIVVGLAAAPSGQMRKFSLGAVGVTRLQVHERPLNAAAELAQFIKAGSAHQVRVWKYGIRRSGISTHVSPSGRFKAASAAGSVTAQPCTIHDLRSVRYKAGDPSGTEPGSFATKVSSMFHLSFRTCRGFALTSSSPPSSRLSICKFLQVPGARRAGRRAAVVAGRHLGRRAGGHARSPVRVAVGVLHHRPGKRHRPALTGTPA